MTLRGRTAEGERTSRKATGKDSRLGLPRSAVEPESAVRIRLWDAMVTLASSDTGDLLVTGESPAVVDLVNCYIHDKLLFRGRTLSDRLRAALEIAKAFNGDVADLEDVRAFIRNGWVRLLKSNLVGEPVQCYGARLNEFLTWRGLDVTLEAGSHHVRHYGGPYYQAHFYVNDPAYLTVQRSDGTRRRWRWERLTRISFGYIEPPPSGLF